MGADRNLDMTKEVDWTQLTDDEISRASGLIEYDELQDHEKEKVDEIKAEMPPFLLVGDSGPLPEKAFLWEPVKKLTGKHLPCMRQNIGSCVGHGAVKALWYTAMFDIVVRGDRERPVWPWEPGIYGMSRVRAGMRGRGSGSTGTGAAKAVNQDGCLPSDHPGLPKIDTSGTTINVPGSIDMEWSDGRPFAQYADVAKKFTIQTIASIESIEDAQNALANGFGITIASNWGGLMRPPVKEGVLLSRRSGSWAHQMSVAGYWVHPVLGLIFNINNSWGEDAHGSDPADGPPGGFWVLAAELASIIRSGEVFAYSFFNGFPAAKRDWMQR